MCPLCSTPPHPPCHATYLLWWKTPFRASFLPSVPLLFFKHFWMCVRWQALGSVQRNKTIKSNDIVSSLIVYQLVGRGHKIDNYVHKSTVKLLGSKIAGIIGVYTEGLTSSRVSFHFPWGMVLKLIQKGWESTMKYYRIYGEVCLGYHEGAKKGEFYPGEENYGAF